MLTLIRHYTFLYSFNIHFLQLNKQTDSWARDGKPIRGCYSTLCREKDGEVVESEEIINFKEIKEAIATN